MAENTGFFKGEKKKKKKSEQNKSLSFAPVFTPPQVLKKGKDNY